MTNYGISLSIDVPDKVRDNAEFDIAGLDVRVEYVGALYWSGRQRGNRRKISTIQVGSENRSLENFLVAIDRADWLWSADLNNHNLFLFPSDNRTTFDLSINSNCLEILERRSLRLCVSG